MQLLQLVSSMLVQLSTEHASKCRAAVVGNLSEPQLRQGLDVGRVGHHVEGNDLRHLGTSGDEQGEIAGEGSRIATQIGEHARA